MAWTKIFWVKDVQKSFSRVIPTMPRQQIVISKRYQAEIRKQFRLNGVPWLYSHDAPVKSNPRDKRPKMPKRMLKRQVRLDKIQKALLENQQKKTEFRQMRLNGRPLGDLDRIIQDSFPSWIKREEGEIIKMRRKNKEE